MECQTIFSKRGNNWGTLTVPLKLLQGSWLPSVPRKSLYFDLGYTHNPKVGGSNPPPATKEIMSLRGI